MQDLRLGHQRRPMIPSLIGNLVLAAGALVLGPVQAAEAPPGAEKPNIHLADRDEPLFTNHGFDEFFGNLSP